MMLMYGKTMVKRRVYDMMLFCTCGTLPGKAKVKTSEALETSPGSIINAPFVEDVPYYHLAEL